MKFSSRHFFVLWILSFINQAVESCLEFVLTIVPDDWPQEITWDLIETSSTKTIIASGGPYEEFEGGDTIQEKHCIARNGCYNFTIYDSFKDGICCTHGTNDGSYVVTFNGTTIQTGGEYEASESVIFGNGCVARQNPISSDCRNFNLTIVVDEWPEDISWELRDGITNSIVASREYQTPANRKGHVLNEQYCIPDSCYNFTIYDSNGDGLCCDEGPGSYTISFDGVEVGSGGEYGFAESVIFGMSCPPTGPPVSPPVTPPTEPPTEPPSEGGLCFSTESTVKVEGRGIIPISELKLKDRVQTTAEGRFGTVFAFAHRQHYREANFVQLITETSTLELTSDHMVFLANETLPIPAFKVQVGHILTGTSNLLNSKTQEVLHIHSVRRMGYYAPITTDGTIVVDGIVASSYTGRQSSEYYLNTAETGFFHYHWLSHMVAAPLRVLCTSVSSWLCDEKLHNDDGSHIYFSKILTLETYLNSGSCSCMIHLLVFVLIVGISFVTYLVESFSATAFLAIFVTVFIRQRKRYLE